MMLLLYLLYSTGCYNRNNQLAARQTMTVANILLKLCNSSFVRIIRILNTRSTCNRDVIINIILYCSTIHLLYGKSIGHRLCRTIDINDDIHI